MTKGTSIGRGSKTTFGDKYGYPSPFQYVIRSSFEAENNKKGVKIGLGRENLKYGGIFKKSETPDPAHYTPKDSRTPSPRSGYTMRPKLKEQEQSNQKNPGPGQCTHDDIQTTAYLQYRRLESISYRTFRTASVLR